MSRSKKAASGNAGGADMNFMFGNLEDVMKQSGLDVNDPSLEAELNALMGGDDDESDLPSRKRSASPAQARPASSGIKASASGPVQVPATSPKRIVPDIQLPDISALVTDLGDDDVDESDPTLLAELSALEGGSPAKRSVSPSPSASKLSEVSASNSGAEGDTARVLNERITCYKEAIKEAAEKNESSKVSRYERQLGTLNNLLKQHQRGKSVDPAAIPPPVFVRSAAVSSTVQEPATSVSTMDVSKNPESAKPASKPVSGQKLALGFINQPVAAPQQELLQTLISRRESYKQAALDARNSNDLQNAKQFVAVCKQLDATIEAAKRGENVSRNSLPPEPSASTSSVPDETDSLIASANALVQQAASATSTSSEAEPKNLLQALELRFEKHQATRQKALQEGNESKAGRLSRVCSQYSDAIRVCKQTGTVSPATVAALPNIPGLPELTVYLSNRPVSSPPAQPSTAQAASLSLSVASAQSVKTPQMKIIEALEKKKNELKANALKAKQSGQTDVAKECLRTMHGLQPLLDAAQAGLPVDMKALREVLARNPANVSNASSNADGKWEVVDFSTLSRDDAFRTLANDLQKQIALCQHHIRYFEQLGRVNDANKFKSYLTTSEQDYRTLQNALSHGDPVPKFHYETRTFTMTKCCPDLSDSDLSIEIVRGINFRVPDGYSAKDFQTFVTAELPLSSEQTHSFRVSHASGGTEHVYNHAERVQINRRSAAFQRIVKSKQMKCEVYAKKKSLFGKDILLGTANVRLNGLENECDFHTSFELLDEKKKPSGGLLEVRLRLRSPLIEQKATEQRERWLVIDQFLRAAVSAARNVAGPAKVNVAPAPALAPALAPRTQPKPQLSNRTAL